MLATHALPLVGPPQRVPQHQSMAHRKRPADLIPPSPLAPSVPVLRRDSFEFGASLLPQHVPVHAAPADDLPTPAPLRRESTGHHSVDSAPDDVPKMELVLDLDHTLLNAVEAPGVGLPPPGCTAFTLQSPGGGEVRYLLRLRDGLASFLEQAARIAKLHVYTMGTASYCREVMTLVDPKAGTDGQLVTGKLLCRDDGQAAAFDKSLEHVCKGLAWPGL